MRRQHARIAEALLRLAVHVAPRNARPAGSRPSFPASARALPGPGRCARDGTAPCRSSRPACARSACPPARSARSAARRRGRRSATAESADAPGSGRRTPVASCCVLPLRKPEALAYTSADCARRCWRSPGRAAAPRRVACCARTHRRSRPAAAAPPARPALQVQHDAALVAVQVGEVAAHALGAGRADTARVVTARRLHLDHVGAHVAQHLRGVGAEHDGGDVDHADAGERAGGLLASWSSPDFLGPQLRRCRMDWQSFGAAVPSGCPFSMVRQWRALILTGDVNLMNVDRSGGAVRPRGRRLFGRRGVVFSNLECCLYQPPRAHSFHTEGFFADPPIGGEALRTRRDRRGRHRQQRQLRRGGRSWLPSRGSTRLASAHRRRRRSACGTRAGDRRNAAGCASASCSAARSTGRPTTRPGRTIPASP